MLTREDLLTDDASNEGSVADLVSRVSSTISPSEPLIAALERMLEEGSEHLAVVEGDQVVGILTKTDILRAGAESFALERAQPGWRSRRRVGRR